MKAVKGGQAGPATYSWSYGPGNCYIALGTPGISCECKIHYTLTVGNQTGPVSYLVDESKCGDKSPLCC